MKVYNYHFVTGEFISTENADESPLEPGVFLIPANSTTVKPLIPKDGHALVFRNGTWGYLKDLRGTKYWMPDYSQHTQLELGELPEGATTDTPENHIGETYWLLDGSQHAVSSLGPLPAGALLTAPTPTPEVLAARARNERNSKISRVEWRIQRYQQQVTLGLPTVDTEEQYLEILTYVQELRDITTQPDFPEVVWPTEPKE